MAYSKMLPSSRRFQSENNPGAAGMQRAKEESEGTRRNAEDRRAHAELTQSELGSCRLNCT